MRGHHELRIAVGPPAVRYQPPMPPEFLPVPARPIVTNVNMNTPVEARGAVDVSWERQLYIEARD
jgi:hypothetical protein